jgi:hypothetical protein
MNELMVIVLQLPKPPLANGRMPEQRLGIQRCLRANHFAEEIHRQNLHPRRSRLLAVDQTGLLPPAEVQRLRAAKCCHEDWLLAAGQRPAVTETFTDNIPIIRCIGFHLHYIAYAWWVSPLPSNGVCASAIVFIHPKSTRIRVCGRTKRPCCLSETSCCALFID